MNNAHCNLKSQNIAEENGKSSNPFSCAYRIFGTYLEFCSESEEFAIHVDAFLSNLKAEVQLDTSVRFVVYQTLGKNEEPNLQICSPELQIATHVLLGAESWRIFRLAFIRLLLTQLRSFYLLHAAAVQHKNGRVAVILGPSNVGKTSIKFGLLERECRALCDDYSPVRQKDGRLIALPVGATVTSSTVKMFPHLASVCRSECQFFAEGESQWTISPSQLYETAAPYSEYADLSFFFVRPNFGAESRIQTLSATEALWWLSVSSLNSRNFSPKFNESSLSYIEANYQLASVLVERHQFFELYNGDIRATVDLVMQQLEK